MRYKLDACEFPKKVVRGYARIVSTVRDPRGGPPPPRPVPRPSGIAQIEQNQALTHVSSVADSVDSGIEQESDEGTAKQNRTKTAKHFARNCLACLALCTAKHFAPFCVLSSQDPVSTRFV